jgi:hypothetical protein
MVQKRKFLGLIEIERNADCYESRGQYGTVYVNMPDMELLQNLEYYLREYMTYMADRKLKLHLDYNGLTTSYVSDHIEYWRMEIEWDKGLLTKIKEWLKLHHGKFEREDWVRYTQTSNKQTENGKVFM